MTKLDRQIKEIREGKADIIEVLEERQSELRRVESEGKRAKNSFKMQCLAQEFARLTKEYDKIEAIFC